MKALVIALLLLMPVPAFAAVSEDAYLAARDAAIKAVDPAKATPADDERLSQEEARLRGELEAMLRDIVGPVAIPGFTSGPTSNLDTLVSGELGFGQLDGLAWVTADDKMRLVVTTRPLLTRWLKDHADWWPGRDNVPQEVAAALASDAFYTQAISSDAAVSKYADITVTPPKGASAAIALLVARSQDIGPRKPDEILIAVVQDRLVFVLSTATDINIAAIPACDAIWRDSERKAEKVFADYQKSGSKDEKLFATYTRIQEEGDAAFRRCFAERARTTPFFRAVTTQAQSLVDRLASR